MSGTAATVDSLAGTWPRVACSHRSSPLETAGAVVSFSTCPCPHLSTVQTARGASTSMPSILQRLTGARTPVPKYLDCLALSSPVSRSLAAISYAGTPNGPRCRIPIQAPRRLIAQCRASPISALSNFQRPPGHPTHPPSKNCPAAQRPHPQSPASAHCWLTSSPFNKTTDALRSLVSRSSACLPVVIVAHFLSFDPSLFVQLDRILLLLTLSFPTYLSLLLRVFKPVNFSSLRQLPSTRCRHHPFFHFYRRRGLPRMLR